MNTHKVAVVRYDKPLESAAEAVRLSEGFSALTSQSRVFIKPNIVFWTKAVNFPKWGVITTSRIVHDMVVLLKEHGVHDITIGEGTVVYDPKDRATQAHAYETLGYRELEKRYGVKLINVFERDFEQVQFGDGLSLRFNADFLASDFLVNIPVLKTHAQTMVSLGIKNVKGLIDVNSRKKCHSADPTHDLHFMVSLLADKAPQGLTIIDGIFTNERGPAFEGNIRRTNVLVASKDTLSADKVGALLLGYQPADVPHIAHVAGRMGRTLDLTDVDVVGERIEDHAQKLAYTFPYTPDDELPLPMAKMGISGFSYRKYDLTMCTYCSLLTGAVLGAVAGAWKGRPWDDVEALTGKLMTPSPDKKHSILIGKCLWDANKNRPDADRFIAVKSCPPSLKDLVAAFHKAGIDIDPERILQLERIPGMYMKRYRDKPEFDESLFTIPELQ